MTHVDYRNSSHAELGDTFTSRCHFPVYAPAPLTAHSCRRFIAIVSTPQPLEFITLFCSSAVMTIYVSSLKLCSHYCAAQHRIMPTRNRPQAMAYMRVLRSYVTEIKGLLFVVVVNCLYPKFHLVRHVTSRQDTTRHVRRVVGVARVVTSVSRRAVRQARHVSSRLFAMPKCMG